MCNKIMENQWLVILILIAIVAVVLLCIYLYRIRKYQREKRLEEESRPPEPTFEEKREKNLKENIGKHIILWKAKTVEVVVLRKPVFDYTNDAASTKYVSHYEDKAENHVTSAIVFEGIITNATQKAVEVNHKGFSRWYFFGIEPEKIYECNIIK